MAATWIQGFEIHDGGDDARRLVECVVRRLTGHPDAAPDTEPGILQIPLHPPPDTDVPAIAERLREECAAELGIADPWQLLSVLRPG